MADEKHLHYLYYLSMLTIIICFLFVGHVSYLMFAPFDEPEIVQPFKVMNEDKTVQRGGTLHYEIILHKKQDVSVTSYQYIVCADGNLVTIANSEQHTRAPVGKHSMVGAQNVPHKTSLGECKLVVESTYHVTKLKDVNRTRETEWFTVID